MINFPPSVSTYQYRSSAVKCGKIHEVFTKKTETFLSFMIGLPIIITVTYFAIVLSIRDKIEKWLEDPKEHKNFAALIVLGVTFAWFATIVDILALIQHEPQYTIDTEEIYYIKQFHMSGIISHWLKISVSLEIVVIFLFDILPLSLTYTGITTTIIGCCIYKGYENMDPPKHAKGVYFWTYMLPLIPPLWCLASRFGFIIVSWTSFIRHSAAFTVFYIFGITAMFVVLRQTYRLIIRCWYGFKHKLRENEEIKKKMKERGISILAIWIIRVIAAVVVLFYAYLMFGLWLLPVSEVVEDAPVYLNDALQLVFIMLAFLISYGLFSKNQHQ